MDKKKIIEKLNRDSLLFFDWKTNEYSAICTTFTLNNKNIQLCEMNALGGMGKYKIAKDIANALQIEEEKGNELAEAFYKAFNSELLMCYLG